MNKIYIHIGQYDHETKDVVKAESYKFQEKIQHIRSDLFYLGAGIEDENDEAIKLVRKLLNDTRKLNEMAEIDWELLD